MTPEQAKELLPIIKAFAYGKTIQYRRHAGSEWADMDAPAFNQKPENYRIKPEIMQVKAWIVVNRSTGRVLRDPGECSMFYSKESAEHRRSRTTYPDEWAVVEMAGSYER